MYCIVVVQYLYVHNKKNVDSINNINVTLEGKIRIRKEASTNALKARK